MQAGLLLYCEVPNIIKIIRSKYDEHNLPAHITLAYLINTDNKKLLLILKKQKKFSIILDEIIIKDDIIALKMSNVNKINNILKKINIFVDKLPKSGFHLSLVYKRGYKNINKKIKGDVLSNIKLPIKIDVKKIWLMKRNKNIGKDWYRSKTIFLI